MKKPFDNPPMDVYGSFGPDFDFRKIPANRDYTKITLVYLLHVVCDALGLVLAYACAYWLGFKAHFGLGSTFSAVGIETSNMSDTVVNNCAIDAPVVLAILFACLFVLYGWLSLYRGFRYMRHTKLFVSLIKSNLVLLAVYAILDYVFRDLFHDYPHRFIPMVLVLNVFTTWFVRRLFNNLLRNLHRSTHNLFVTHVLLIGEGREADELLRRSQRFELKRYHIEGHIPVAATPEAMNAALEAALAAYKNYTCLMVAQDDLSAELMHSIRRFSFIHNMASIIYEPDALELHNPFSSQDEIFGRPMVHYPMPSFGIPTCLPRRLASRLAAGLILIPFWIFVFPVVWIAVKIEDGGPVFFFQERYGRDGRPFRMWKFRTMCVDAEAKLAELRQFNEADGGLFKMRDDPRITRVGALLRKTSIDELPQLVNIWKGDMRFVGPRPLPCKDLLPYKDQWYLLRQAVEPGLTCIWQVTGRSDIGFEKMCELDLWYELNRDWMLDLKIFWRTFRAVFLSSGAY